MSLTKRSERINTKRHCKNGPAYIKRKRSVLIQINPWNMKLSVFEWRFLQKWVWRGHTKTPVIDFQAFGNISDKFTMQCIYTKKHASPWWRWNMKDSGIYEKFSPAGTRGSPVHNNLQQSSPALVWSLSQCSHKTEPASSERYRDNQIISAEQLNYKHFNDHKYISLYNNWWYGIMDSFQGIARLHN